MKQPIVALLVVLCLAASPLWGQSPASNPASKPASSPSTAAAEEQLYLEWAKKVEKTVNAGDPSFLNKSMNIRAMVDKGLKGLDLTVPEYGRLVTQAMASSQQPCFGNDLCKAIAAGGSYRFLRLRQVGGQTVAIFRFFVAGNFNYDDYYLAVDKHEQIIVNDLHSYTNHGLVSEYIRVEGRRVIQARQGGAEAVQLNQGIAKLKEIERLSQEKKFREALDAYDSIPDRIPGTVKYDKPVLSQRLKIAAQVSKEAFERAVEDYSKTFPTDPTLDTVLIELYFLRGEYDECIAAFDRLNGYIGGDPYLDAKKANLFFQARKPDLAKAVALKAIKEEPTLKIAYDVPLIQALAVNDFKEVVRLLTAMESAGIPIPDLTKIEKYADFVKSPEYGIWMRTRGSAASPLWGQIPASSPTSTPTSSPLTAADQERLYLDWAKKIEKTINAGDPSYLNKSMDIRAMANRGLKGLDLTVPEYTGCISGAMMGVQKRFGDVLCKNIKDGGSYHFLRLRQIDGQTTALFRCLGTVGFNYQDYYLTIDSYGRVVVDDADDYFSGERLSGRIRSGGRRILLKRKGGAEADQLRQGVAKFDNLMSLYHESKFKDALAVYDSIPDQFPGSMKYDKTVMIIRLDIASEVSVEAYRKAMDDFRKIFPTDPAVDMQSIDWHFFRGEYEESIAAIDRLSERIGGDAYLNVVKANTYTMAAKPDLARAAVLKAVKEEPTLMQAYDTLLAQGLDEKDFKEVVRLLSAMESAGIPIGDLTKIESYADFVNSPEYVIWMGTRRPHATTNP